MKLTDFVKDSLTEKIDLVANGGEEWVKFKSTQSPEFIEAQHSFNQSTSAMLLAGKELISTKVVLGQEITERSEDYKKLFAIMFASIIVEWSLEDDVNLENAATFLYNNPSVLNELDRRASALTAKENAKKPKPEKAQKASSDS